MEREETENNEQQYQTKHKPTQTQAINYEDEDQPPLNISKDRKMHLDNPFGKFTYMKETLTNLCSISNKINLHLKQTNDSYKKAIEQILPKSRSPIVYHLNRSVKQNNISQNIPDSIKARNALCTPEKPYFRYKEKSLPNIKNPEILFHSENPQNKRRLINTSQFDKRSVLSSNARYFRIKKREILKYLHKTLEGQEN